MLLLVQLEEGLGKMSLFVFLIKMETFYEHYCE